jgi:hypothetical protein
MGQGGGGQSAAVEGVRARASIGDSGVAADGGSASDSDPVAAEDDQARAMVAGSQGMTTVVSYDTAQDMVPGSEHGADAGTPTSLGMDAASGVLPASSAWLEG